MVTTGVIRAMARRGFSESFYGHSAEEVPETLIPVLSSAVHLTRVIMDSCKMMRRRMASLILVMAVFAMLPRVAQAQVYLYGRADFQTGINPAGVVAADFNGDGRPDLAISNFYDNTISILLGSASGGFVAKGIYSTGSSPAALVVADFNDDKKLDLAVVNENAATVSILLGNGDGTFQSHIDYPAGQTPVGIVAADFNSDGKIDLAVLSQGDSAITVLLGGGDGTFEVQALIPVASAPTLLAGGDVNGDGKIDLITSNTNFSSAAITVLVSKGDGTFTQVESQAPVVATALTVGDFNGDGKLDAVIAGNSFGLYLSFGDGDGSFQNPVAIPNAPQISDVQTLLTGDFNHDGKLDIALAGVWTLLGKGDGTFRNPIPSPAGTNAMAVVDVNQDGKLDLAALTGFDTVAVLVGNGNGSFMNLSSVALAPTPSYPGAGVAADFNGDGKLDLAVAESNYPNGQVSVELGRGDGTFQKPIVSSLSTSATNPNLVLEADFNGDGKSDLVVGDDYGNGFQILLGQGDGAFKTPVDTVLNYTSNSLAVGDFNRDGKADVVVSTNGNSGNPSVNIYLSNGDGTFSAGAQYSGPYYAGVTVADVNGDGNLDLVVSSFGSALEVFLGNGDGTFKSPTYGTSDTYSSQAVVGDFNGDGKLDIAVGTYTGIAFLAGNGDGTFRSQVYSDSTLQFSGTLLAADFSGDGKLDLVGYAINLPGRVIMRGNGDGTFQSPFDYASYGLGVVAVAGDFNSDGVSDLGIPGQIATSNTPVVSLYLSTPTPNLLPTALNFGSEQVGKTSPPKKVKLTNAGNAKLKISGITVSGDFLEQNNCGKGLAVGKSCSIQVSFKPTQKGIRAGQVTIADNAPAHTQKVALQGMGK